MCKQHFFDPKNQNAYIKESDQLLVQVETISFRLLCARMGSLARYNFGKNHLKNSLLT